MYKDIHVEYNFKYEMNAQNIRENYPWYELTSSLETTKDNSAQDKQPPSP